MSPSRAGRRCLGRPAYRQVPPCFSISPPMRHQEKRAREVVVEDVGPSQGAQRDEAVKLAIVREEVKRLCQGQELFYRAFAERNHSHAELGDVVVSQRCQAVPGSP